MRWSLRAPCAEVETDYRSRVEGSESKLGTVRDGLLILKSIVRLYVRERPRQLYLAFSIGAAIAALLIAAPVFVEYWATGLVPRLPTAILSGLTMMAALVSGAVAVILDSVVTGRAEAKRLSYLAIPIIMAETESD
ncbi:hypothetical protein [Devosia algicola]|uniref:hypothetical protein n=1 Tax=Devosia algicola TaxID=3026418 RepID=UPI002E1E0B9E